MAEKSEKSSAIPGTEVFKKATDDQLNRLGLMMDEAVKMQSRWLEASAQSLDHSSELAKTSVKYVQELSAEWRRLSMESTKKAMEFFAR